MTGSESSLPPGVVALIPMRNFVLFPHALTAISVGRDSSISALRYALEGEVPVGVVLQKVRLRRS
ncbi:LON peptidase substrate-binding domain-containing protein [Variovorax sp. YR216]|uniref:LON peptidase substrate-binding domain-containing protein n=1 Tax=Variovorax sp. YR216 TaxID=1882828 RepID=UPI00089BF4EA|nr:LON peptidase substrate-binding domain-containing protein [Variovorax sp. YR216]SEB24371.1 ATP-dependent Lon protease [Variovorax sp. YR216]